MHKSIHWTASCESSNEVIYKATHSNPDSADRSEGSCFYLFDVSPVLFRPSARHYMEAGSPIDSLHMYVAGSVTISNIGEPISRNLC